jgi:hypothetical protein
MKYSTNEEAEKLVGKRETSGLAIDQPCELDYFCPCNKYHRMEWSEYNGFVWCENCNKDFPSCLCTKDIDKAIDVYLSCIREAKNVTN